MWRSLLAVWPTADKKIDVYAENVSLTQIFFRSEGKTFLFTIETGKAQEVNHAKMLPREINRITWEPGKANVAFFVLWYYGRRELEIGVDD